jgi:hypothetical protein
MVRTETLFDFEEAAGIAARVRSSVGRSKTKLRPHFIQTSLHNNWGAFYATVRGSALHVNGSLGRIVESPFVIAVERGSLDIGRVFLRVFFNVDQNRVSWGLLSGHCSGSGSSCVNSAGSGCGSKTSDSLVYIDVDIGFVNNFPVWSVILIICEIVYLLSNQFLNHIFKSNNT